MKKYWKAILSVCLFVYPIFVFLMLVVFEQPMSIVSLGMLIIGFAAFVLNSNGKNRVTALIMCGASLVFIITKNELVIRFYPFWITGIFLWFFLSSILHDDPIILHFARLWDPSIDVHPAREQIKKYCIVWNWIWVFHFVLVEIVNFYLAFWGSVRLWAIYNGCISYLSQGLMFILQFAVNYFYNKKLDAKYNFDRKEVRAKLRAQQKAEQK